MMTGETHSLSIRNLLARELRKMSSAIKATGMRYVQAGALGGGVGISSLSDCGRVLRLLRGPVLRFRRTSRGRRPDRTRPRTAYCPLQPQRPCSRSPLQFVLPPTAHWDLAYSATLGRKLRAQGARPYLPHEPGARSSIQFGVWPDQAIRRREPP